MAALDTNMRQRVSDIIRAAKVGKTWEDLATELDCSPVWLCSVALGTSSMDEKTWQKLLLQAPQTVFTGYDLRGVAESANTPQVKAAEDWATLSQDPLIYRLHEMALVYGPAIREVIHEKFGDGIMSAVDLKIGVEKVADPNGDRVRLTLDGKFLPYKPW